MFTYLTRGTNRSIFITCSLALAADNAIRQPPCRHLPETFIICSLYSASFLCGVSASEPRQKTRLADTTQKTYLLVGN